MKLASVSLLIGAAVSFAAAAPSCAQPAGAAVNASAQTQTVKTDRYGDPLPAGALVRLGTVRLRQPEGVFGVAFSPDGKQVASCGHTGPIHIWDVATGRRVSSINIDDDRNSSSTIRAIAFSPDGTRLAAGNDRGEMIICDVASSQILALGQQPGRRNSEIGIEGIVFSPDGSAVATCSRSFVQIWDAAAAMLLLKLTSDARSMDATSVAFSPDGNLLAAGTRGGAHIWDLGRGGPPQLFSAEGINSVTFTDDGKTLLGGGSHFMRGPTPRSGRTISDVLAWNIADGMQYPPFQAPEAGEQLLGSAIFSASRDGRTLVSGHTGKIVVWDVPSRRAVRVIAGNPRFRYALYGSSAMSVSRDGNIAAMSAGVTSTNKIFLFDVTTGKPLHAQEDAHVDEIISEDISPDGKWIVTGSSDATVRLWNATTGEHVRKLEEGDGWLKYVEFLPDGKSLVMARETHSTTGASYQGEIKVLNLPDGAVRQHLKTPDRMICGTMSADGARIAVGIGLGQSGFGLDEGAGPPKIQVFDTTSGEKICEMTVMKGQIQDLQFTADGKELWSASEDQILRKWNLASGEEIARSQLPGEGYFRYYKKQFLPGASQIVLGGMETVERTRTMGRLSVCNVDGLAVRWENTFIDTWPSQLTVSHDGRLIASFLPARLTSKQPNRIVLWNAADGRELKSLDLPENSVRSLKFSRDSKLLITGMDLGDTLVWDVSSVKP